MRSTISVVIPTFNRYAYLLEALNSVFSQSRPPDEILVIDDGSTDGTAAKLEGANLPIRVIKQKNAGPAAARNLGFRMAKCDWIALLDSDDLWTSDKLAKQESFLDQNVHLDLLFGHMINFTNQKEDSGPEILYETVNAYCQANASYLRDLIDCLLVVNPIPTSSVIFRRSCLNSVGFLREDLRYAEDFDWWIRWSLTQKCGFLDHVVEKRRIHNSNLIGDRVELIKSELIVLEDLMTNRAMVGTSRRSKLQFAINKERYRLANSYIKLSNYRNAFETLKQIDPSLLPPFERAKWLSKMLISFARRYKKSV